MSEDVFETSSLPPDDRDPNPFDDEPETQSAQEKAPQMFPHGRVHLVGGASGAGKTTLLLQWFDGWMKGRSVLGYKEELPPFMWISYDRGQLDFNDTCARMNIDASKFNFYAPPSSTFQNGLRADLASYLDKNPKIKMFVIEGIQTKTPEGKVNDLKVTAQFMRGLGEFCEQRGVTIIGTAHVSKTREGERFLNPRQRIAGSVSWAGYSSTVVVIEEKDPESTGDARTISILRRNGKNDFFELGFKDGLLVRKAPVKSARQKFDEWLAAAPFDKNFDAKDIGIAIGVHSKSTLYNLLTRAVQTKQLRQPVERGPYRKVRPDEGADA